MHNRLTLLVALGLVGSCASAQGRPGVSPTADGRTPVQTPTAATSSNETPNQGPTGPATASTSGSSTTPTSASTPRADGQEPLEDRWLATVRTIVAGYESWGRVDDEARWAPGLCRMPFPATARISAAAQASAHARKLYFLYAMDPVAYGFPQSDGTNRNAAVGLPGVRQVIVKEAFVPLQSPTGREISGPRGYRPAVQDGVQWGPGDRAGLYIMFQMDPSTPGTDQGWVYATVAADRQTVTGAGMMQRCINCHQEVPNGRLFGVQRPTGHP